MALQVVQEGNSAGDALVVAKFGGSSVKDAAAMQSCAQVLEKFPAIKVAILSATYNTTNELEMLAALAVGKEKTISGKEITSDFATLKNHLTQKHCALAQELGVGQEIHDDLQNIFLNLQDTLEVLQERQDLGADMNYYLKSHEAIYAVGELLSTTIFAAYLKKVFPARKVVWLDSRQYIVTDGRWTKAQVDFAQTKHRIFSLKEEIARDAQLLYVAQGFIGGTEDGVPTTLGREGSDLSAAIYAAALDATELQIWTDVPGIASSDPRQVKEVKYLPTLSYQQANLLSALGAKVLHHQTLFPVMRQNIPVWVGQTTAPEKGTRITHKAHSTQGVLTVQPVKHILLAAVALEPHNWLSSALQDTRLHYFAVEQYGPHRGIVVCQGADKDNWQIFFQEQKVSSASLCWHMTAGIFLLGEFNREQVEKRIQQLLQKKGIPGDADLSDLKLAMKDPFPTSPWPLLNLAGGCLLILPERYHKEVLEDLHHLLIALA